MKNNPDVPAGRGGQGAKDEGKPPAPEDLNQRQDGQLVGNKDSLEASLKDLRDVVSNSEENAILSDWIEVIDRFMLTGGKKIRKILGRK